MPASGGRAFPPLPAVRPTSPVFSSLRSACTWGRKGGWVYPSAPVAALGFGGLAILCRGHGPAPSHRSPTSQGRLRCERADKTSPQVRPILLTEPTQLGHSSNS